MAFLKFIADAGFIGWLIILVGIGGLAVVIERAHTYYKKYSLNSNELLKQLQTSLIAQKTDEALLILSQLKDKPLANALRIIVEKSDRDQESIFQAHDIALSENIPLYTKRLHYLSMLANVATLLGLLGTIHGLILSFQAVASADPATKQALLANGISVSMYTTALGLAVAIPAMVFYSFLVSKQNELMEDMVEKCAKITELLTSFQTPEMNSENIYKSTITENQFSPPPIKQKAS